MSWFEAVDLVWVGIGCKALLEVVCGVGSYLGHDFISQVPSKGSKGGDSQASFGGERLCDLGNT